MLPERPDWQILYTVQTRTQGRAEAGPELWNLRKGIVWCVSTLGLALGSAALGEKMGRPAVSLL
jgi:hypothetical protein